MKYRINVDFGQQGYNEYGGILKIWRLIRKELKRGAHIEVHKS
jgi:hypothetical protein